ncbi:MAG TPA: MauE/DoxX family redox-associated membrane protein [Anaeromyxobacteraceae bacterium]
MRRGIVLLARLALGAIFLYAAATKVPDMAAFAKDVANYRLLPAALVPFVAAVVVGIEIAVGLALATGLWARAAALVAAGMLVVFVAGLSQALLRGIDLRCGCFGGDDAADWWTVLRDLAMLVPALVVLFTPAPAPRREGTDLAPHLGRMSTKY